MRTRSLHVVRPCTMRWETLEPRGNGRYCGECDKVVVNMSNLTEREAMAIVENTERVCGMFLLDASGRAQHRREKTRAAGTVAAAAASAMLAAACTTPAQNVDSSRSQLMGEIEQVDSPKPTPATPSAPPVPLVTPSAAPDAGVDAGDSDAATSHHRPQSRERRMGHVAITHDRSRMRLGDVAIIPGAPDPFDE